MSPRPVPPVMSILPVRALLEPAVTPSDTSPLQLEHKVATTNYIPASPIRADPDLIVPICITPPAPVHIDPVKDPREHTHVHCTCAFAGDPRRFRRFEKRDFGGGFIAGFEIGDADVTIWWGVNGVVDSGIEECQGSRGYGVLPDISLSSRCS
jgi:hypothetical protein